MECPKCGRTVGDGAFICPGCEFILDTSFLGDDITDDERAFRKKHDGQPQRSHDFGEDAMILGNPAEQEWSDFRSRDAGVSQREVTQARFYVGGSTAALLHPDAVPDVVAGAFAGSIRLTPFERHVLDFINGKRSIGRIQKKSGMEDSEFKTSVAMLADKGIIRLRTTKKRKKGAASLASAQASLSEQRSVMPSGVDRTVVAPTPEGATPEVTPRRTGALPDAAFRSLRAAAGEERGSMWSASANSLNNSNVFARAKAGPLLSSQTDPKSAASKHTTGRGLMTDSVRARLQPPTGEVAQAVPKPPSLLPGAPPEDDDLLLRPGTEPVAGAPLDDAPSEVASADIEALDVPTGPRAPAVTSRTSTRERDDLDALRDPTGLGDAIHAPRSDAREGSRSRSGSAPAPRQLPDRGRIHDEATAARDVASDPTGPLPDDDEHDSDKATRAPALPADDEGDGRDVDHDVDRDVDRRAFDDDDDDDDDESFDVGVATAAAAPQLDGPGTAPLPTSVPDLPLDALVPLPTPHKAWQVPAPAPGSGPAPSAPMPPPGPPALPGQPLARGPLPAAALGGAPGVAGAAGRPSLAKPGPPRPSAQSTVGFEQARKAEKIFEQAQKDLAAGKLSSARMNAKLASQFDPSVQAYKDFLLEIDGAGAAPKGATLKPREVILFEEASEAEGRGDYQKAVKLLQEAVAINKNAAALLNRLGVVLSIRLKRHDEALAYLKKAIELEPGSLVYMNNYSKVTALLESAREKDPEERRKKGRMENEKVEIKKVRPKMY